ncbi:MAG: glycosyltransferase, partial [candidate division NC10 bacterium]|nr:glycosyltransferase [candidate division NC10 bacterium]
VITGKGPEEKRVRRLAGSLPLSAKVGFVGGEELRRLLNTAALLVHASEVELEGMAVLEALGCGTPALISDAPHSASRQFAISPDFLFRPGDPDDLARRLDLLLEDPERLRAARRRCLELARGYSFEESVRRLEAVYRRVVARSAEKIGSAATKAPGEGWSATRRMGSGEGAILNMGQESS